MILAAFDRILALNGQGDVALALGLYRGFLFGADVNIGVLQGDVGGGVFVGHDGYGVVR